jgi:HK97 family phage portal protein
VTILGALSRSLENPQLPLTSTALAEWLGSGSSAGVTVTERRVVGLTAWYRGLALLGGSIASLPLKVYRRNTRERVTQSTVLDSPNDSQTPFEFWQQIVVGAVSWGTGYAWKYRDRADTVREVWPIHPAAVTVEPVKRTDRNRQGLLFHVRDGSEVIEATAWDVFRAPYLTLDGRQGIRPLQVAREALGIAIAAEDTAAGFYGRGTAVSGIVKVAGKADPKRVDRFKAQWTERFSGPAKAGQVAVLDGGAEFQPISISPADAQLLESRKFGVTEIARLLGVPPHLIGDVERSTSWGTGIEQQMRHFVQFTLGPWLTLLEQRVTRELLPGGWTSGSWYAEWVLEGLLRGDSQARSNFYQKMVALMAMTPNEVRVRENLEPLDGLDRFLVPSNMALVDSDGGVTPLTGRASMRGAS